VIRAALLSAFAAVALAACALVRGRANEAPAPQSPDAPAARRLVQLDFARQARFAECVDPGCPVRTPKSLATLADQSPPRPASSPQAAATGAMPAPTTTASSREPGGIAAARFTSVEAHRLTLHFALGSASLTAIHRTVLRNTFAALRRADRVVIAGRTDDLGSTALNQSLALARGLAVRDYLLSLDSALPARISIDARGRCCYAVPNEDAQARAQNRRVEITYSPDSGVAP